VNQAAPADVGGKPNLVRARAYVRIAPIPAIPSLLRRSRKLTFMQVLGALRIAGEVATRPFGVYLKGS
jgi:hypothetical protein